MARELALAHAEHSSIGEHGRAHLLDTLVDVEEHDEEDEGDAKRHLRPDAKPEPEREDRRQHHARERIDHFPVRVEPPPITGLRPNQKPTSTPASDPIANANSDSVKVIAKCLQILPSANHWKTCP